MRHLIAALWLLSSSASWPAVAQEDPRSRVVLESDCRTETSRRRLTLFANGTIRLFDGLGATRTMRLAELGAAEREAFENRLREIPFDDLAPSSTGLEGDWVESCRVLVAVPGETSHEFEYGRFDTVSLGLKHVLLVIEDLYAEFESVREATARPRGYEPRLGDILVRRRDGARFEILGFTLDGNGAELLGIDQPITVYILKDRILEEYDPPDREPGP